MNVYLQAEVDISGLFFFHPYSVTAKEKNAVQMNVLFLTVYSDNKYILWLTKQGLL